MRMIKSFRKDNKGASLIAVVIAMVFVVSIGVIIMNITLSNISMKEMELSSKANFYSAEDVLETVKSSLTDKSTLCLENAYVHILSKYASSIKSAGAQKTFQASYLDELIKEYKKDRSDLSTNIHWKIGGDSSFETSQIVTDGSFAIGYYDPDVLTSNLSGDLKTLADLCLKTTEDEAQFEADYSVGTFTLKNVHIIYTDSRGYETSLSTDLIMTTPVLNFDGTNTIEEFMKYCLIADKQINITGNGIAVNGNAYAGCDGIYSCGSTYDASFTGRNIITRGTIDAGNGARFIFGSVVSGNDVSNIWAENIRTSNTRESDTGAVINLTGNMYISDDLSLDGVNSKVNLSGSYYGYNFQKLYTNAYAVTLNSLPVKYERDAAYSSSIVINGRNSKLDMTGLENLTLAGHTFISKGNQGLGNSDILMGESVSVRTNQIEYNIPDTYVSFNAAEDPFSYTPPKFKTAEARAELGIADAKAGDVDLSANLFGGSGLKADGVTPLIYDYVSSDDPISVYYYQDGSQYVPRFYLKFKDLGSANAFFIARANAVDSIDGSINKNVRKFLGPNEAINTGSRTLLTLSGTMLYVSDSETAVGVPNSANPINSDLWSVPEDPAVPLSIYAQTATYTAQNYKSLQLDLTTTNSNVNANTIRFGDTNDKTQDPLFYNLIDELLLDNFLTNKCTDRKYDKGNSGSTKADANVVLIDNAGRETYTPDSGFLYGIIIATGDVNLNHDFTGMVLSGGKITISSGTYTADELNVAKLFEDDALLGLNATFTTVFPTYNNLSSDVVGLIKVADYIGYDNWTKYAE